MKLAHAAVDPTMVRRGVPDAPPATRIPLRILTITVTIFSIGMIAALPFRRTAVPESPAESVAANPDPPVSRDLVVDPWPWTPAHEAPHFSHSPDVPKRDDPRTAIPESDRLAPAGIRRNARVTAESAASRAGQSPTPDGYEAWMVPIDESPLLRERFAATLAPESDESRSRPTADGSPEGSAAETEPGGNVPLKTVSLGRSTPVRDDDEEPWVAPPSDPSYSFRPARDDSPAPPASERHWIRQPREP